MRKSTFIPVLLAALFLSSALSHPTHRHKPRDIEAELVEGAEEGAELFDVPRVHDTTEQVHEHIQQNNVTTQNVLAELKQKEAGILRSRKTRLPSAQIAGDYSYKPQPNRAAVYSGQGVHANRMRNVNRESGFARYPVGVTSY